MTVRRSFLLLAFAATCLNAATVVVDAAAGRHPISPEIYGLTLATPGQLRTMNSPLNRWGGDTTSLYNWQFATTNFGSEHFFESAPVDTDADTFIRDTRVSNAQAMITIPMIGWAAAVGANRSRLASFSVAKYGPQQATDSTLPDAGNGIKPNGDPITGNDPSDANVSVDARFEQAWVQHIVQQFGGVKYYLLDNEPSLWHVTHRDVHPDGATMDEVAQDVITTASLIRAADPNGLIGGPEEWGWLGFLYSGADQQTGLANNFSNLPDRKAHGNVDYLPFLLSRVRAAEIATSTRLLDIVTVHFSPGGGVASDDVSAAVQLLRNRSTRSLWDPNYTDETLFANVQLIPRLRAWANDFRAGTPIGITSYNWGADGDISGATAQADVLGILGREGVDVAARWNAPAPGSPVSKAFQMYRNYDGTGKTFGDTSVLTTVPDPDTLAAFSAIRSSDKALTIIIINKDLSQPASVNLQLANFRAARSSQRWQLNFTNTIDHLSDVVVPGTFQVPAQSITLLVVPSSGEVRGRAVRAR